MTAYLGLKQQVTCSALAKIATMRGNNNRSTAHIHLIHPWSHLLRSVGVFIYFDLLLLSFA